jgi:HEPN domain-containing protein
MEYLGEAREFARVARSAELPTVAIQNAFKAAEFALKPVAHGFSERIHSHADAKRIAHRIGPGAGRAFTELLDIYHGSYDRKDGKKAERAIELMEEIMDEAKRYLAR